MSARVPDVLVERLALGELDDAEAKRVRARLEAAGELDRLEAIDRSNAEILSAHPPAAIRAEVERRANTQGAPEPAANGWRYVAVPLAVAAAAVAFLVLRPRDPGSTNPVIASADVGSDTEGGTRIKGDPRLLVYRKADSGTELMSAEAQAGEGDLLQVGYQANGATAGVILSVDGRGSVTLHHPLQPDGDPSLKDGGKITLRESFELDDAPEFERFFFVARDEGPVDVRAVLEVARELAADPARRRTGELDLSDLDGDDWVQRTLLIKKR